MANEEVDEDETDEESLPSLAGDLDPEQSSNDEPDEVKVYVRKPDPNASRSSKRSEARKLVNYNTHHHRDDDRIPGFQHKARSLKRSAAGEPDKETVKKIRRLGKLRKPQQSLVTPLSQDSVDVDDLVEETLLTLEVVAPSTTRISLMNDDHVDPMAPSSQGAGKGNAGQIADFGLEDNPLPTFTNIRHIANGDDLQPETTMQSNAPGGTSEDLDEALLNFVQVTSSDANGVATIERSEEATTTVQHPSNDTLEAAKNVSDTSDFESSHTQQEFTNSGEADDEGAITSSTSPGLISKTIINRTEQKPDAVNGLGPTAMSPNNVAKVTEDKFGLINFTIDHHEGLLDPKTQTAPFEANLTQAESGKIHSQNETVSTGVSKKSDSSKTLEGDYDSEVTGARECESVPGTVQVSASEHVEHGCPTQATDQISAFANEGPSEELMQAAATTLQAMLEQDIATSQQVVANSSSSDMLM